MNVEVRVADKVIACFADDGLRGLEVEPEVRSLRVGDVGGYRLVWLSLAVEHLNGRRMDEAP